MEQDDKVTNRFVNFAQKISDNVVTDNSVYQGGSGRFSQMRSKIRTYDKDEIESILRSGNLDQLRELSNSFFQSSGFYRRLLVYYATILFYTPILIPHLVKRQKSITDKKCSDKYYSASEFISSLNFEQTCKHFAMSVLRDGAYYGMLKESNGEFLIQDLPFNYCRSRFRALNGVDIVELNVEWFDTIKDEKMRYETLSRFPKEVRKLYRSKKQNDTWIKLPINVGIHFTLFGDRPFFTAVTSSIVDIEDAVEVEKKKDEQLLRALLVQEIPHTPQGDLLLEPEEALELHKGLTNITKKNDLLDAITSYGTVKVEKVLDENHAEKDSIEKMRNMAYAESGVSKQLFAADGNNALEHSIQNDIAMMKTLADTFAIWLKAVINEKFSDKHIIFDVEILPVGPYNRKEYLQESLNAAQYGYSFIVPSVAMGFEQSQMLDLKDVEINLLHMNKTLIPLQSSHTLSGKDGGKKDEEKKEDKTELEKQEAMKKGPSKDEENRSEKTLQNRESMGGGEQ